MGLARAAAAPTQCRPTTTKGATMTARQYRIPTVVPALVAAAVLAAAPAARAHHSASGVRPEANRLARGRRHALRVGQSARLHLARGAGRQRRDGRVGNRGPAARDPAPPRVGRRTRSPSATCCRRPVIRPATRSAKVCCSRRMKRADTTLYDGKTIIERAHDLRCGAGSGCRRDRRRLGHAARHGRHADLSESRSARSADGGRRRGDKLPTTKRR